MIHGVLHAHLAITLWYSLHERRNGGGVANSRKKLPARCRCGLHATYTNTPFTPFVFGRPNVIFLRGRRRLLTTRNCGVVVVGGGILFPRLQKKGRRGPSPLHKLYWETSCGGLGGSRSHIALPPNQLDSPQPLYVWRLGDKVVEARRVVFMVVECTCFVFRLLLESDSASLDGAASTRFLHCSRLSSWSLE